MCSLLCLHYLSLETTQNRRRWARKISSLAAVPRARRKIALDHRLRGALRIVRKCKRPCQPRALKIRLRVRGSTLQCTSHHASRRPTAPAGSAGNRILPASGVRRPASSTWMAGRLRNDASPAAGHADDASTRVPGVSARHASFDASLRRPHAAGLGCRAVARLLWRARGSALSRTKCSDRR